jgi:hypothetical protein
MDFFEAFLSPFKTQLAKMNKVKFLKIKLN